MVNDLFSVPSSPLPNLTARFAQDAMYAKVE